MILPFEAICYNNKNILPTGRDQSSVWLAEQMEIRYLVNRFPGDHSHVGCMIHTICFSRDSARGETRGVETGRPQRRTGLDTFEASSLMVLIGLVELGLSSTEGWDLCL
jgi:hypothetical protein